MKKVINVLIVLFSFILFTGFFSHEVQASTDVTIKYKWKEESFEYNYGTLTMKTYTFLLHVFEGNTDKELAFKATICEDGKTKNLLRVAGKSAKSYKAGKSVELGFGTKDRVPNKLKVTVEVEGESKTFYTSYATDKTTEKTIKMKIKADAKGTANYKDEADDFISKYTIEAYDTNIKDAIFSNYTEQQLIDIYAQGQAIKTKEKVTDKQKKDIDEILDKIVEELKNKGFDTIGKGSDENYQATGNGETVSSQDEQTLLNNAINDDYEQVVGQNENIYQAPSKDGTGGSAGDNLDDMIKDADSFVTSGDTTKIYEEGKLESFSTTMFNIFATVGAAVAIIVGLIIGIKYMTGSIDAKVEVKKMLVPYLVGCIVVFGGFGIWKLVIIILSEV